MSVIGNNRIGLNLSFILQLFEKNVFTVVTPTVTVTVTAPCLAAASEPTESLYVFDHSGQFTSTLF